MNQTLMEELLNEDESATLDFKRDQYPFIGATDEQKGELLKDILALANAWRRTDGYILIGVEEVRGGRSRVVGTPIHLDDASLQQFVNSKTQRPVTFLYEVFPFEGVQVGVIKIPIQDRPIYLNKKFGKLEKHVVYIRRGSSTDEADPDEIAKMGGSVLQHGQGESKLELQFADGNTRTQLGREIRLISEIVNYHDSQLSPPPRNDFQFALKALDYSQRDFWGYKEKMAKYIADTSMVNPVGFQIGNTGSSLAKNVCLEIIGERGDHINIYDEYDYPDKPNKHLLATIRHFTPPRHDTRVDFHGDNWVLKTNFGNVQPKATVWSESVFYIGSLNDYKFEMTALIYADNLPEPVSVPLTIVIETKHRDLSLGELE